MTIKVKRAYPFSINYLCKTEQERDRKRNPRIVKNYSHRHSENHLGRRKPYGRKISFAILKSNNSKTRRTTCFNILLTPLMAYYPSTLQQKLQTNDDRNQNQNTNQDCIPNTQTRKERTNDVSCLFRGPLYTLFNSFYNINNALL